jgi:ribonuclease HII
MEKKQLAVLFVVFLSVLAAIGCSSSQPKAQAGTAIQSNPNIPEWYIYPKDDPDYLFGVGSAKLASTNRSQQAAEHRARTSLTFTVNTYSRAMQDDYGKESGTTSNMAVLELFETIDRQLASAVLRDAVVIERFVGKDGNHWVLMTYPKVSARADATGVIENAASKMATINRDAAIKAMDAAFEQMSRPTLVDRD